MLIIAILFLVGLGTFLCGIERETWEEISTAEIYLDGYFYRVRK